MLDDKPDYTLGDVFNEILISRGAPKEKFSAKQPSVKVAGHEKPPPLSTKQQDLLSLLKASVRDIENYINWDELSPEEINRIIKKDDNYKKLITTYLEDISEAVRIGLFWHPLVFEFVNTYKALGKKEILRAIKRGLETGVRRPIKEKDVKFVCYLDRIEKYRGEGKTWLQIRRILMKRKIIGNISWQALRKKVAKFAPHILPDTEFVIMEDSLHLITENIMDRMKELWRELCASGKKSQYRQEVEKLLNKQGSD